MFEQLIQKIAQLLDQAQIPYMIIGGQAVLVYGEPRLTKDIDVTLGIDPSQASRLLALLPGLGVTILVEEPDEFLRKTFVLPVMENESGIRIDFVFSLSDYERQAIQRAKDVLLGGVSIKFIGLEDLIIHKVLAGRPRDLEDVRILLLKNQRADLNEIQRWLTEFDRELGQDCMLRLQVILTSMVAKS